MTTIIVDTRAGRLLLDGIGSPCVIGRGGACSALQKREGDGRTPYGDWPIRAALIRPDRGLARPVHLPSRWLRRDDGWSDDPRDPAYNRAVRHPHAFSAERLWRDDTLYDAILVLGHNDSPPLPGAGSAIFLHLAAGPSTEGCVAVPRATMARLLLLVSAGDRLQIG